MINKIMILFDVIYIFFFSLFQEESISGLLLILLLLKILKLKMYYFFGLSLFCISLILYLIFLSIIVSSIRIKKVFYSYEILTLLFFYKYVRIKKIGIN